MADSAPKKIEALRRDWLENYDRRHSDRSSWASNMREYLSMPDLEWMEKNRPQSWESWEEGPRGRYRKTYHFDEPTSSKRRKEKVRLQKMIDALAESNRKAREFETKRFAKQAQKEMPGTIRLRLGGGRLLPPSEWTHPREEDRFPVTIPPSQREFYSKGRGSRSGTLEDLPIAPNRN